MPIRKVALYGWHDRWNKPVIVFETFWVIHAHVIKISDELSPAELIITSSGKTRYVLYEDGLAKSTQSGTPFQTPPSPSSLSVYQRSRAYGGKVLAVAFWSWNMNRRGLGLGLTRVGLGVFMVGLFLLGGWGGGGTSTTNREFIP